MLVVCDDAAEQAAFVAQRVLELREEGADLNRMAVLYRSHFHALELQLELTRRNIPFSITSGIRFFEQAHIKDVTAYLKLVANPRDELSFKRLAQLLPGIGGKGAEKLWQSVSRGRGSGSPSRRKAETECRQPAGAGAGTSQDPKPATRNPIRRHSQRPRLAGAAPAVVPKKAAVAWAQFVATIAQLEAEDVRDGRVAR